MGFCQPFDFSTHPNWVFSCTLRPRMYRSSVFFILMATSPSELSATFGPTATVWVQHLPEFLCAPVSWLLLRALLMALHPLTAQHRTTLALWLLFSRLALFRGGLPTFKYSICTDESQNCTSSSTAPPRYRHKSVLPFRKLSYSGWDAQTGSCLSPLAVFYSGSQTSVQPLM